MKKRLKTSGGTEYRCARSLYQRIITFALIFLFPQRDTNPPSQVRSSIWKSLESLPIWGSRLKAGIHLFKTQQSKQWSSFSLRNYPNLFADIYMWHKASFFNREIQTVVKEVEEFMNTEGGRDNHRYQRVPWNAAQTCWIELKESQNCKHEKGMEGKI